MGEVDEEFVVDDRLPEPAGRAGSHTCVGTSSEPRKLGSCSAAEFDGHARLGNKELLEDVGIT